MTFTASLRQKQIPLYIFTVFFCYLFVFQNIVRTFVDEAIIILIIPLLSIINNKRVKFRLYKLPIVVMFLLILAWSTEPHKSFLYYLIMVEALVFLEPTISDAGCIIVRVIKRTSIINAIFVFVSFLFPGVMSAYARLVFSESASAGYIGALKMHYYSGLNNQVAFTALYIALGIIAYMYDTVIPKQRKIGILAILWMSLFLTNKRAILVYLLIAMFAVYYFKGKKNKRVERIIQILMMVVLFIGLLYIAALVFPNNSLVKRMMLLVNMVTKGGDIDFNVALSGRLAIYNQVIELFKRNKIWGIGWQNFTDYSRFTSFTGGANQGHNVFLQLLCETGIVGFILFVILNGYYIFFAFRINIQKASDRNSLFPGENSQINSYSKMALAFLLIYYLIWLSGNALYDFTCVYTWVISLLLTISIRKSKNEYGQLRMRNG